MPTTTDRPPCIAGRPPSTGAVGRSPVRSSPVCCRSRSRGGRCAAGSRRRTCLRRRDPNPRPSPHRRRPPGDTLWSIAEASTVAPNATCSFGDYVDALVDLNGGTRDRGRPAACSCPDRRRRSVMPSIVARRALPELPRRRHQGRRLAPRRGGRGRSPSPPVPVVRLPVHHVRARRRGAADRRQVRRADRAVRPGEDRRRHRRRHQGPDVDPDVRRAARRAVEDGVAPAGLGGRPAPRSASPCSTSSATVDEVAYLRFASVYKNFDAAADFHRETRAARQAQLRRTQRLNR